MKKFLQQHRVAFTKKFNTLSSFLLIIAFCSFNQTVSAQQIGIFESYAIMSINGSANAYYDAGPQDTANPNFQGANLGTFGVGQSLVVKGGQNKTFKNNGGNVTGGNLRYRVYLTSAGASGAFIALPMSFVNNIGGLGDQLWEGTAGIANILSGLNAGSYTLEVYTDATGVPGTTVSNNGGSNFRATFTVAPVTVTATGGTTFLTYTMLAAAVTAINGGTHTGTIVCYVNAGYAETAPVGGYNITATGTTSNTITFVKSGTGTNPTLTAFTPQVSGTISDAIFKIVGGDFITIDGFTILENAANTTSASGTNNMTEFGVALLNASTTNGCQNITIKNNTIDLDRTYPNTFGIYSSSNHSATNMTTTVNATTPAGSSSNLTIIGNQITDVNTGIVVSGPNAAADQNDGLIIGGSALNANTITNYGTTGTFSAYSGVSGTVNGIQIKNTKNYTISFNTITSSTGVTTTGNVRGIFVISFTNTPTGTLVHNINNNNISVRGSNVANTISGIVSENNTGNTTTTLNINANNFNNFGHAVAGGTGAINFITNAAIVLTTSISNNTFTNINVNTTGNVTFFVNAFNLTSAGSRNMNDNSIVTSFNKTGAGGTVEIYKDDSTSATGSVINSNNNNFSNITVTGATTIAGWSNTDGGSPTKTFNGNTFSNWIGGSSSMTGLVVNFLGGVSSISNNIVSNWTGTGNMTGLSIGGNGAATTLTVDNNTVTNLVSSGTGGTVAGMLCSNPSTVVNVTNNKINTLSSTNSTAAVNALTIGGGSPKVSKNKIYNISASGATATVAGIVMSGGNTVTINNNYIGDLRATASSGTDQIAGIIVSGGTTANVYFNTIRLNATSTGTNFGTSAISTAGATLYLRNNILVNTSTPAGTGLTVALRRAVVALTTYASTSSNNLLYSGTPSASNLLYTDGTSNEQTLATFKTRVSPMDANSISENAPFISTTGSDATFLHIDPTIATGIEKGAVTIAGFTTDFDGDIRGSVPDIGADEGTFTALPVPVITSIGATSGCQGTSLVVTGTNMFGVTTATIGGTAAAVTATTATTATITVGAGTTGVVSVTSPTGSSTGTDTFTVFPAPTTTWAASTAAVCPNAAAQTTTLAYSATTGAPTTYSITWSATPTNSFAAVTNQTFAGTPGGGTISINVPAGALSGTYTGTIKVTNAGTCISAGTQTFTVVIGTAPVAPTTTSLSICTGATIAPGTGLTSTQVGAATLTGSQTLNFNVTAQPTETNALPGNIVASATLTALPAGAIITSLVYTYNGITALGSSWRSDVRLGLGGTLIESAAAGTGAPGSAGLFNYTRTTSTGITGTPTVGGIVNLLYRDNLDDNFGVEATFTTGSPAATVVVNYSYPNPTAVSWYTAATGGTSLGNGTPFNPVGVAGSGVANTNTAGTFPFYAEVSNGTCPSTRVLANLIIGAPLTSTATTSASPVCEGTSVNLNNTPVGGVAPYTYSWSDGATQVSSIKNPVVATTTTKTYTVTVTDACGITTTASISVTVNPTPLLTIVNPAAACAPATINITSAAVQTVNNGTTTKYYTTNALAIAGAAGDLASPSALTVSGTYYIRVEAATGCFKILPVTVLVNAAPTDITLNSTASTICQNDIQALTATGGNYVANAFTETANSLPSTFTLVNTAGTGTATRNTTYFSEGTSSVLFNTASTNANVQYALNSNLNLTNITSATLTFSHIAAMEGTSITYDKGFVDYSVDGGTNWVSFPASSYAGSGTLVDASDVSFSTRSYPDWISQITGVGSVPTNALWKNETINIPAAALASTLFRVRFRYTTDFSTNYYGWLLDNIKIEAVRQSITWSPVSDLYTDAAATIAYVANASAITVYTKPAATVTYTATSTLGTCTKTATSVITVNPPLPASVSISANPTGAICAGTSVTFTASPTNGGTTPTYIWKKGGVVIAGETTANYTSTTLANNDSITVELTSNASPCLTGSPATSNAIVMSVNPNLVASVTIAAVPAGPICAGTSVTFTASPTNGNPPTYVWKKGGVTIAGETGVTYTSTTLANGDAISVEMFSTAICTTGLPATSNTITIIHNLVFVAGTVTGDQVICSNKKPSGISLSGSTGSIVKWQRATNMAFTGATDINVTTTTLSDNDAGAVTSTTYFRAETSGTCGTGFSTYATVEVGGTATYIGIGGPSAGWSSTPDATKNLVFDADYSDTVNLVGCNCTVNANKVVTIPSGYSMTLTDELNVDPTATMTFENNAPLIQINDVTNINNVKVIRNTNLIARLDYTLWSSPVADQNLLSFSPATFINRFYTYNTTFNTNSTANGAYSSIAPSTNSFQKGAGYLIRVDNNHLGTVVAPIVWPGNFTGVPNNGITSITAVNGGGSYVYNAVGNPYPSPINIAQFMVANGANIESTLYFWRRPNGATNTGYNTLNTLNSVMTLVSNTTTANGIDPQGIIQTGQGFLVAAKVSSTATPAAPETFPVVFNNGMRTNNLIGTFFRAPLAERHAIWLNLTNATDGFAQMAAGYFTGASTAIDDFDSKNFNDGALSIGSYLGSKNYIIQGRALPFDLSDVIPLTFKTSTDGTYKIAIDHAEGMFSGAQNVYLKDVLTNTYTDLSSGSYSFATAAGTVNNRFEIVFQRPLKNDTAIVDEASLVVYKNNGDIVVSSGNAIIKNVKIYDMRGRLLLDKSNTNTTEVRMTLVGASQVVLVKTTLEEGQVITKKVIN